MKQVYVLCNTLLLEIRTTRMQAVVGFVHLEWVCSQCELYGLFKLSTHQDFQKLLSTARNFNLQKTTFKVIKKIINTEQSLSRLEAAAGIM